MDKAELCLKTKAKFYRWSFPAALPLCLSPSSASWRTTTSTDASSALCCPSEPPSTWTAPPCTRPWQPSSSPKSIIMSWTLDRSSLSGRTNNYYNGLLYETVVNDHKCRQGRKATDQHTQLLPSLSNIKEPTAVSITLLILVRDQIVQRHLH